MNAFPLAVIEQQWNERQLAKPVRQPAFAVEPIDTTGCGDVFHGAYAAAIAQGTTLAEAIRFATAAASIKAERTGGQLGYPTLGEVEQFLNVE